MMNNIAAAGLYAAEVTLHVGEGSFRPIKNERVEDHQLETEEFFVPRDTIRKLAARRRAGKRIIAVGTTVTRTLETLGHRHLAPVSTWDSPTNRPDQTRGESDLFISEPFEFRVVDAMITNFHLPRSSLLVMVSAFAGRNFVLRAYKEAVKKGYRFYSYGDSMLIV
jgi:S-adenosylmethionine:tRNA ribosyltransferase-isomerase